MKMIKPLLLLLTLTSPIAHAADIYLYSKTSIGYKFNQSNVMQEDFSYYESHPISSTFELGLNVNKWSFGVKHDSQPFDGWPVNNKGELHKTEVFISYTKKWEL